MQKAMRVIALGIDYGRFLRFEALTDMDLFYAPTREEYDYCVQFVIDAAFRIAEVEANPSRRLGGTGENPNLTAMDRREGSPACQGCAAGAGAGDEPEYPRSGNGVDVDHRAGRATPAGSG